MPMVNTVRMLIQVQNIFVLELNTAGFFYFFKSKQTQMQYE